MSNNLKRIHAYLQPLRQEDGAVSWAWIVAQCPFCQATHSHRGGELKENPFRTLGERESNCKDENARGKYELIYGGLLGYWDRTGTPPPFTSARYVSNPTRWLAQIREIHTPKKEKS
ncbi:MAG TPA: hypothetical protein P5282_07060 [Anaerolineaceae bacterium]|nr:hypothetical protein [Anaerolineaceae bacterium]HRV18445.1 hypothetical protein [Myxococcota bacterium]